ncbi:hypothetical protein FO519_002208 [Halicephalobus sp. NKZ332]|nr:hypothetical protein FO519_002208 [Halicephalobus sp. NKZ332]
MNRQLQVLLLSKSADNVRTRRSVVLEVDEDDNILSLKKKLAKVTGLDSDSLNIIFCGQTLPVDLNLDKLLLGQSTSLVATVSAETTNPQASTPSGDKSSENKNDNGSYFVYCKNCSELKQGKLRIYCSVCNSTAVLLESEPENWSDIFDSGPLIAECKDCEEKRRVNIVFKCRTCDEPSAALRHIKRNRYNRECIVCGEICPQIAALSCQHASCLDCFISYLDNSLQEWTFFRKPIGFTVGCPMFDCNTFVEDIHHFHLLGLEKYRKYQRLAAEKFLNILDERQYCPFPNCGAAFTVELFENETMVCCPECSNLYCTYCRSTDKCRCKDPVNDGSVETIKAISKPCPVCKVPTERDGGCAHISCTQCRTDWCFICSKEWTTECQWDHWFD